MTVVWTDIRDLPNGEFAAVTQSVAEGFISEAQDEISEASFGDRYDQAVKYLAAHLLAVMTGGSASPAGPVVSEAAGRVSRSYAAMVGTPSSLDSLQATSYGRRYMDIRRQMVGGPRVL